MKPVFLTLAALAVAMWTVGCSTPRNNQVFASTPAGLGTSFRTDGVSCTQRLINGDRIAMTITGLTNTNLPPIVQLVGEDGTIELPLIGKLVAAGKTPKQLEVEIVNALVPDRDPRLRLRLTIVDQFYYVAGQVRQPVRYSCSGEITVLKAITIAGGFSDFARVFWFGFMNGRG